MCTEKEFWYKYASEKLLTHLPSSLKWLLLTPDTHVSLWDQRYRVQIREILCSKYSTQAPKWEAFLVITLKHRDFSPLFRCESYGELETPVKAECCDSLGELLACLFPATTAAPTGTPVTEMCSGAPGCGSQWGACLLYSPAFVSYLHRSNVLCFYCRQAER